MHLPTCIFFLLNFLIQAVPGSHKKHQRQPHWHRPLCALEGLNKGGQSPYYLILCPATSMLTLACQITSIILWQLFFWSAVPPLHTALFQMLSLIFVSIKPSISVQSSCFISCFLPPATSYCVLLFFFSSVSNLGGEIESP